MVELRALVIEWFFQPAQTPHFGASRVNGAIGQKYVICGAGLGEGGVADTSDEILKTLLFEMAVLLNTRPLTYTSSDPDDFRAVSK